MRKWIAFVLLLLVGAEVFAQGSAPSPPQLWRRKGTADTSFVVIKTGDTVMVYDTAQYTKLDLRGTNQYWLIPDSVRTATLISNEIATSSLTISGIGFIMNTFAEGPDTIWSLLGNGHEIVNGYLTVTLGASIEGSEVTNQTLTKSDVDTTATFPFGALYHKTTAVSDSEYKSKYYIDHNLFGYTVTGTPSNGQVAVYDGGTGGWTFGAGGSGSGDDGVFDMTLDNSNYVLGATTYTGGYINTSTHWQRGDTGINLVKSGQHPGDTILHQIDWNRVQRNDSTRNVRTFKTESGEYMMIMEDSASFTKISTGNNSGFKFNEDVNIHGNQRFFGSNREIDSIYGIKGAPNGLYMDIFDADGVAIQGLGSNYPVTIGSSTNWTFKSDTLKGTGTGSKLFDIGRVTADTVQPTVVKYYANGNILKQVADTDVVKVTVRDTTNNITTDSVPGTYRLRADNGLTEMDSVALHGRLRMYDGTNKSRIDSASGISADTLKTLPGGFLTLQGATSGRTRIKGNASAITSYDLVLPAAQGAANQALINDGSGNFSWGSAGTGNGSADFDTTTTMDSNIVKGAGGTILLDVHKNSTPSVVIGKGATMTSLIVGGNTSGITAIDTSALIYNSLDFGNGFGDYARLDSQRVVNMIRLHRYYFTPTDFYGSPEAYLVRHVLTSWNEADTTSFPNNMYKRSSMFYAKDTNGSNTLPYNFTWVATERDSLFSTVYNILTGFTQADSSSLYAAALYVNETKVDTLNPQKAVTSFTVDSLNWTDRQIAQGDVVTVLLYLKLNPVGTSKKRVDIKDMYLNMRRY